MAKANDTQNVAHLAADDLDDRQIRGYHRAMSADKANGQVNAVNEKTTFWMSKRGNRFWKVDRDERNRRGQFEIEYRCSCGDYQKNGRIDCEHIFAERIRRGDAVVTGEVDAKRMKWATAPRRPARKRLAADGRSMRTVEREVRVANVDRIPELLRDLARAMSHIQKEQK